MKFSSLLLIPIVLFSCTVKNKTSTFSANPSSSFLNDTLLHAFQPAVKHFIIDPTKDTILTLNDRNSKLHIPSYCFIDKKGNTINSKVDITFKEFTSSADIAFSGILMQYKKGNESLNFNSSGMFEIKGYADNSAVDIHPNKPLSIDYTLTQNVPNTDFYKLNDRNTNWDLVQEIPTLKETMAPINVSQTNGDRILNITFEDQTDFPEFKKYKGVRFQIAKDIPLDTNDLNMLYYQVALEKTKEYGKYQLSFGGYDEDAQFVVRKFIVHPVLEGNDLVNAQKKYDQIFNQAEKETLAYMKELERIEQENERKLKAEIAEFERQLKFQAKLNEELLKNEAKLFRQNQTQQGFISPEFTQDPGHTYPAIVKGLSIASFGIYNCDQVYRIQNKRQISPIYVDQSGNEISDPHVLSLMDLKINGAFSFQPSSFQFDTEGEFVVALFTNDKKLYVLKSEAILKSKANDEGRTKLVMIDKTSEIKNSEDLRKFIGV